MYLSLSVHFIIPALTCLPTCALIHHFYIHLLSSFIFSSINRSLYIFIHFLLSIFAPPGLQAVFSLFDSDGDGSITMDEVGSSCIHSCIHSCTSASIHAFTHASTNTIHSFIHSSHSFILFIHFTNSAIHQSCTHPSYSFISNPAFNQIITILNLMQLISLRLTRPGYNYIQAKVNIWPISYAKDSFIILQNFSNKIIFCERHNLGQTLFTLRQKLISLV